MALCKVEQQEVLEVKKHYSRMMGIKDLMVSLSYHHTDGHEMIEKLTNDYIQTKELYELWWREIIDKYDLQTHKQEELSVSFTDGIITLNSISNCSNCEGHLSTL